VREERLRCLTELTEHMGVDLYTISHLQTLKYIENGKNGKNGKVLGGLRGA